MSDSVSVRSAQEEMDRVVKTPFIMLRFGVPIKQMLIDLMTKPEPAEITELKKTHPQLHAVMKRCEVTRKIYARNNNQGQLDDWAAMQDDKSDSLNHQILKELIAAFIIQTPRAPVPPILEPLLADIDWAELHAEWRKKDCAIKSAAQSNDLKQVMEKRNDVVGYGLDRSKICDRELAKVKSLRDAVALVGQGADAAAKAQFLASNLILVDFVVELVDLMYPTNGAAQDFDAIIAAVRAMCADIVAATDADSPAFALGSKAYSCQTRFNSLRAVRMRSVLSYGDQALEYGPVKEGSVVETLMTMKLKSHRLPHSISNLRARADTPKRDKEEPSKRSASQEAKAAKEAAKEAKK